MKSHNNERIVGKKRWMVVAKGRRHVLLHLNEELSQYKKLHRIPNWVINRILDDFK